MLLIEAPPAGYGLGCHANTNDEIIEAVRAEIAEVQPKKPNPNREVCPDRRMSSADRVSILSFLAGGVKIPSQPYQGGSARGSARVDRSGA